MYLLNNQLCENFRLPNELICPYCNGKIDGAIELNNPDKLPPRHDDFSVCVGCGEISNYVNYFGELSLRKHTERDIDIAKQEGIYDTLIEYQQFIRNTPHGLKVK